MDGRRTKPPGPSRRNARSETCRGARRRGHAIALAPRRNAARPFQRARKGENKRFKRPLSPPSRLERGTSRATIDPSPLTRTTGAGERSLPFASAKPGACRIPRQHRVEAQPPAALPPRPRFVHQKPNAPASVSNPSATFASPREREAVKGTGGTAQEPPFKRGAGSRVKSLRGLLGRREAAADFGSGAASVIDDRGRLSERSRSTTWQSTDDSSSLPLDTASLVSAVADTTSSTATRSGSKASASAPPLRGRPDRCAGAPVSERVHSSCSGLRRRGIG